MAQKNKWRPTKTDRGILGNSSSPSNNISGEGVRSNPNNVVNKQKASSMKPVSKPTASEARTSGSRFATLGDEAEMEVTECAVDGDASLVEMQLPTSTDDG